MGKLLSERGVPMNRAGKACLLCAVVFIIGLILVLTGGREAVEELPGKKQSKSGFAQIQVPFIENQGQAPEEVAYYAQTHGGSFYVTGDGAMVLALPGNKDGSAGTTITERILGNDNIAPRGQSRAETVVNIYAGSQPEEWRKNLPSYRSLVLDGVDEGFGLELKAYGKNIEKIFRVHSQQDPSLIRIGIEGALEIDTGEKGDLAVHTPYGPVTYSPPVAYQEVDGDRRAVKVAYVVQGTSYGFQVGEYDRNLDLVIDPLIQSTYVGGMGNDSIAAVQIHPTSGKVYLCGSTNSTGFGPTYLSQTDSDAYVARLNAALTSFEQITRLEGSGNESCQDLRIDGTTDRVFLMGDTDSTDFPVVNAAQSAPGGGDDTFIAYLDADLTLGSATYLGGSNRDDAVDMALDGTTGDLYIVGDTESDNFPTTAGAPQPNLSGVSIGLRDGFVVRYNSGLAVQMATYLGGSLYEDMGAVSVHPSSGDIYVAGSTNSFNLPGSSGGAQPSNHGVYDAFVARYNSTLTTLLQTSYLGGASGSETDVSMEIHPSTGKIFLIGITNSWLNSDFPTVNAVQSTFGGLPTDLFAAVFNETLTTIEVATYLGGDDLEDVFPGNMVLTAGGVYLAGNSSSSDLASTDFATGGLFVASFSASLDTLNRNVYLGGYSGSGIQMHSNGDLYFAGDAGDGLPGTTGGAQDPFGGGTYDAFLMCLSPDLNTIVQSTYLGGADNDRSAHIAKPHIAIHPLTGNLYIVGSTGPVGLNSYVEDFPGTDGGAQPSYGGTGDGFVAYFDPTLAATSVTCTDSDGDGYSLEGGDCGPVDCDDTDPDNYPGNSEVCDGQDNDCDTSVDEGLTFDGDGDGYTSIGSCGGFANDCDDGNAAINPGATEACNAIDDDCNGVVDDGLPLNMFYADNDSDGYGDAGTSTQVCLSTPPSGFVTDDTDCDDHNSAIHPGATEACNGLDDDCDTSVDEDLPLNTYYADADGDGYGDLLAPHEVCNDAAPFGYTTDDTDCDDGNGAVNPGGTEVCNDLIDQDCDTLIDCDDPDCSEDFACEQASGCWDIFEVDDAIYSVDIALDSSDNVHMCYFAPNTGGSGGILRYATGAAETPVGSWYREDVGFVNVDPGAQCAIAAGTDGSVHIAYVLKSLERLLYASRDTSTWDVQIIEESGVDGECAITLDLDDHPHISYRKNLGDTVEVRHASYFQDTLAFITETVFSTTEGVSMGIWNDIAVSSSNTIYISYNDDSFEWDFYQGRNNNPFVLRKIDGVWEEYTYLRFGSVPSILGFPKQLDYGYGNRLKLDSSGGIHQSSILRGFVDEDIDRYTVNRIVYGYLDNLADPDPDSERHQNIDEVASAEASIATEDIYHDLAVDDEENAHIAYYDKTSGSLRYVKAYGSEYWDPPYSQYRPAHTEIIDDSGDAGRSATIAVDSNGGTHIAYIVDGTKVRYAKKNGCVGPVLALSPLRWHFNLFLRNEKYLKARQKEFYVKNLGDQSVNLTGLNLSGIGMDFGSESCLSSVSCKQPEDVSSSNPQTLQPGEVYSFYLVYAPDSIGATDGQLEVQYNSDTIISELSGTGLISGPDNSGCCALSSPGEKFGKAPVLALVTLVFGLLWWRRKRLD